MFTNILVGIDGWQGGRDAIALARQLAVTEAALSAGTRVPRVPRSRRGPELLHKPPFQSQPAGCSADRRVQIGSYG